MKKRILAFLLAMLMVLPMSLTLFAAEEEEEKIDYVKAEWESKEHRVSAMELYATSPDGNMLLYVDVNSGEMAVKNVKTGDIFLSNPHDIAASNLYNREKPYALSQLNLTFTYVESGVVKVFHSYDDCFSVGQARVEKLPNGNGIKVYYAMGPQEQRLLVPNKIKKSDFDAVLLEMKDGLRPVSTQKVKDRLLKEGADREPTEEEINAQLERDFYNYTFFILQQYVLYGPAGEYTTVNGDKKEISQSEAAAFRAEYPISATEYVYVIANKGDGNTAVENYIKTYTSYDFKKLDAHYEAVKESVDDFSAEERPKFDIQATYEITNQGLVATVDAGTLSYNREKYIVNSISILPYFNSANAVKSVPISEKESVLVPDIGYTFIPDGSGALVRFEDLYAQNQKQVQIESEMYGNDYAYYQIVSRNAETMTMPVFGLTNNTQKTGFFAIIEDGDALAVINSNHTTAYHSIYSSFKITPTDTYDLADSFSGGVSGSKKVNVSSDVSYTGLCKVNYITLIEDDVASQSGYGENEYYENSYVGMAKCYREYLQAKKIISDIPSTEINPEFTKLFLETFGSIKVEEKIATFPVTVNKELTTFEDIKTIHKELKSLGVGNASFILKGFANGGLVSNYPTKMKWQKVLGGEEGLIDLLSYAEENNIDIIPDVEFSYSYGSSMFGGTFKAKKHAVRTLDNRYTTKRAYYAATQTFERTGGVAVSSAAFDIMYEKFYKAIEEYDIKYLSVRSLGSDLNSDFDEDEYYDREAAKDNVVAMLKLLKGENGNKGFKLLVDSGNAYAIPYADAILSASLDSSRRSEMSESVPFFGMVYHGSVEFAGNAFNMEGDTDYAFLKAIENGAVLYFTIAKQNVELLKFEQQYSKYYSVSYDNLKETIKNTYVEYNSIMKDLQDKYIVDHDFVDATRTADGGAVDKSQVVMVEYEGGIGFILNYSTWEINVTMPNGENATIKPFGYQRYEK